jgi:hypothetical protein
LLERSHSRRRIRWCSGSAHMVNFCCCHA